MALSRITQLDKTEIVGEFKHIQCRHATWVEDDGVMVGGKSYSRHVINPNDDVSNEPVEIQAIVAAVHTPEIRAAYTAYLTSQSQNEPE